MDAKTDTPGYMVCRVVVAMGGGGVAVGMGWYMGMGGYGVPGMGGMGLVLRQ